MFLFRSYKGLSKEVWYLALITLINRAGSMVIPFLSIYLTGKMGFSLDQTGWMMSCFGLGSVAGSWLGGRLTDKSGPHRVMVLSLVLSGVCFILLQFVTGFWVFCLSIFILMSFVDAFRPALFVALNLFSNAGNKTRSSTLVRLAINLGFTLGPATGGFIISVWSYHGLFWVDGITSIAAGLALLQFLHPGKTHVRNPEVPAEKKSAYKDNSYRMFIFSLVLFGIVFFQYFSTVPLYYKQQQGLDEFHIGLLMAMNGFLVFLFEMPLVHTLERIGFSKLWIMCIGSLSLAISLLILNITAWKGVLIAGMCFMTLGEMLTFPFANTVAMEYSKRGNQGQYMAFYSLAFSISLIISHNAGMHAVELFDFENTWYILSGIALCGSYLLYRMDKKTDVL